MMTPHNQPEIFGFSWPGKAAALEAAQQPVHSRLCSEQGTDEVIPDEGNIFIAGENSEALRLLLQTHEGRVKMIYIDPPYNTGNASFAYADNFRGVKKGTHRKKLKDVPGTFHGVWLSMMYTRLLLAARLLTSDGVIFISIDDHEVAHLRMILDEVYGADNFIGQAVWINRTTPNDAGANFATDHEYILIYAKDRTKCRFAGVAKDLSRYRNPDNDPNGAWVPDNPSAASGTDHYRFPVVNPYTGQQYLPPKGRYWAFSASRVAEWEASGKLVFPRKTGKNFLLKKYFHELRSQLKPVSSVIQGMPTAAGTRELKVLFGGDSPFRFPKPVSLLQYLIGQATAEQDIILDFFAGSGTTAQAVMELNCSSGSRRTFICVQLPEANSGKDERLRLRYPLVSDVTSARIRKVIEKLQAKPNALHKELLSCQHFRLLQDNC